jgi:membrane protease YdiL (CAAX protease family)
VLAVFEEIGWRAWLLPRLEARLSSAKAVILTSAIWALWHVPFQLSGIQHIDGISPPTLAVYISFGIFASGLMIGWLWLQTRNIWIVSLAHGSLNNWGQYAFKFMTDRPVTSDDLLVLSAGSLAQLLVGIVLLTARGMRRRRQPFHRARNPRGAASVGRPGATAHASPIDGT